jgi:hypothetical protein
MPLESGPEQVDESQDTLEPLKGDIYAHFPVVEKGEELIVYKEVFAEMLKDDWENACILMNWVDLDGNPVTWEHFLVSSNPEEVVSDIQEGILEEGGKLPKYGMDGKFGAETSAALNELINPALATALDDVDETLRSFDSDDSFDSYSDLSPEEIEKNQRMQQKFISVLDPAVHDAASARMEEAGLQMDLASNYEDLDLSSEAVQKYREDSRVFRRALILEEPSLAKVEEVGNEVILILERTLDQIDFSKINTAEDLEEIVENLAPQLEEDINALDENFDEDLITDAILDAEPEILLAYISSFVGEVGYLALSEIDMDGSSPDELMRVIVNESLIPQMSIRV